MTKIKDTNYLYISARVRALERGLLTHAKMERMLDAKTDEEAAKVLFECGYPEMETQSLSEVERIIAEHRMSIFEALYVVVPNRRILDIFLMKYDYHNIKTLIKAQFSGEDSENILIDSGLIKVKRLVEMMFHSEFRLMSKTMHSAITEAREVLARTFDPQLSDFVLDKGYYKDMQEYAAPVKSKFLMGYIQTMIDIANLKSTVRAERIGRRPEFLRLVLIPGGNIGINKLLEASASSIPLEEVFSRAGLGEAAAAGSIASASGESLTRFEKLCDNSLIHYIKKAKNVPFGEQPVVSYVASKESEATAIRIIMSGRYGGVSHDAIRERLRDVYV